MTDLSNEVPRDLVILARIVSACTLGLWAFAAGLLIGVFLLQGSKARAMKEAAI
jgi:hypothetical protein